MSHGAKYMRFLRAGRNPKRSKIGPLAAERFNKGETDRVQLFALWADSAEDWGEVELRETRFKEETRRFRSVHGWKNRFDLMRPYEWSMPSLVQPSRSELVDQRIFHKVSITSGRTPDPREAWQTYSRIGPTPPFGFLASEQKPWWPISSVAQVLWTSAQSIHHALDQQPWAPV